MRTLDEIAVELLTDNMPGTDGCSNADRAIFISEVMDCETIDINQIFDFTEAVRCKDVDKVEAAKQLATLQIDYMRRAFDNGLVDRDDYEIRSTSLILDIQRLNWHLRHLHEGRSTPPFSFIH